MARSSALRNEALQEGLLSFCPGDLFPVGGALSSPIEAATMTAGPSIADACPSARLAKPWAGIRKPKHERTSAIARRAPHKLFVARPHLRLLRSWQIRHALFLAFGLALTRPRTSPQGVSLSLQAAPDVHPPEPTRMPQRGCCEEPVCCAAPPAQCRVLGIPQPSLLNDMQNLRCAEGATC
jgi:hypothetical protein